MIQRTARIAAACADRLQRQTPRSKRRSSGTRKIVFLDELVRLRQELLSDPREHVNQEKRAQPRAAQFHRRRTIPRRWAKIRSRQIDLSAARQVTPIMPSRPSPRPWSRRHNAPHPDGGAVPDQFAAGRAEHRPLRRNKPQPQYLRSSRRRMEVAGGRTARPPSTTNNSNQQRIPGTDAQHERQHQTGGRIPGRPSPVEQMRMTEG